MAEEPKRSEAQLKALKRSVSGIAPSMYNTPPAQPELEGAAEARKNQKPATPQSTPSKYYDDDDTKKRSTKSSKAKSFTRTMRHK